METRSIHLAYVSLLILLGLTTLLHFPMSLYFFAGLKALVILYIFMGFRKTDEPSKIFMFLALVTLAVMILFIYDDVAFR